MDKAGYSFQRQLRCDVRLPCVQVAPVESLLYLLERFAAGQVRLFKLTRGEDPAHSFSLASVSAGVSGQDVCKRPASCRVRKSSLKTANKAAGPTMTEQLPDQFLPPAEGALLG